MFRYALNASTIRPTPILEKISIAGQAGYGAIELWHDEIDDHLAHGGTLADLQSALADQNLAVPTTIYLGGWFNAEDTAWPGVRAECARRMEQAGALGAPHIIAGPAEGRPDYALGTRRYRELLELGESIGVHPAMEFLGFVEQLNTIEDALEIMTAADHPHATTVLDPFHIFRGGGDLESIAKLTANQIAVSHFNDTPADPPREEQHDHSRVMPGDGHLNLVRYCELLAATGYNGWLSLELFNEQHWAEDPLEVARIGLEKMRTIAEG